MASIVSRPNGHHWIQYRKPDGKRATLRLGKCSKSAAKLIAEKVERLIEAIALDRPIDQDTANWLTRLPDDMHKRFASGGLIPPRPKNTVEGLVTYYLAHKQGKPRTLKELSNAGQNLIDFFTADRQLTKVTPGDVDEFRTFLETRANRRGKSAGGQLAPSTAQKRLQKAKAMFQTAKRKGWILANPFDDVTIPHAPLIEGRVHFVDPQTTYRILDACKAWQMRLLVALARFGGLRHPSETLLLRWSWIDWENDRITFRSPKTEHIPGKAWRTIPIFAELRPYLDEAFELAGEGCDDVILADLAVGTSTRLTNRLRSICRKIGIELWPKPWMNMRSTRETEIEELFGMKCACDWIGNTEAVAKRHYLQVTKEHHARAVANGAGAKRPAKPPKRRSKKRST